MSNSPSGFIPPSMGSSERIPRRAHDLDPLWVRWLTVMMWIATVMGIVSLLRGGLYVAMQFQAGTTSKAWSAGMMWMTPAVLFDFAQHLAPPMLIIFAARSCMRLSTRGRVAVLIWAWLAMGFAVWKAAETVLRISGRARGGEWYYSYNLASVGEYLLLSSCLPFILLLFLSRPQIKELFECPPGFDPLMPESTLDHRQAP